MRLGLSEAAFIEGCPQVRGGLYRVSGVSSRQGVAFIKGSTVY